jgi:hypothetical protein
MLLGRKPDGQGMSLFFFNGSSPIQAPGLLFSSVNFFTDGRTPWTSHQFVPRPLLKHRTTQTQNKHIHTSNIHALSGIRTHKHSVRASEDSSCLRPRSYCDRLSGYEETENKYKNLVGNSEDRSGDRGVDGYLV